MERTTCYLDEEKSVPFCNLLWLDKKIIFHWTCSILTDTAKHRLPDLWNSIELKYINKVCFNIQLRKLSQKGQFSSTALVLDTFYVKYLSILA